MKLLFNLSILVIFLSFGLSCESGLFEIIIEYNENPEDINWNLSWDSIDEYSDGENIASGGANGDSICLLPNYPEGFFDFTISNNSNGICCNNGTRSYEILLDSNPIGEIYTLVGFTSTGINIPIGNDQTIIVFSELDNITQECLYDFWFKPNSGSWMSYDWGSFNGNGLTCENFVDACIGINENSLIANFNQEVENINFKHTGCINGYSGGETTTFYQWETTYFSWEYILDSYGCTNPNASNYNAEANVDDGSCCIELWGVCYNIEETISLNLYSNGLTGEISSEIGNLVNLEGIYLSSNQLTGGIPPEIGNLVNLEELYLSYNELDGEIPFEIGNFVNLEELYLSSNFLSGEIPESICDIYPDLTNFLITHNNLCPPYPECIENYIGFQNTTNCSSMSISEQTLPIEYTLHQPFPNPFNPTSSISFSIPKQSQTSLKVYDIKGNLISTLLNQPMNVGHHQIEWNDDNLSSGTYFIRINSGEFSDVKKVVLVK